MKSAVPNQEQFAKKAKGLQNNAHANNLRSNSDKIPDCSEDFIHKRSFEQQGLKLRHQNSHLKPKRLNLSESSNDGHTIPTKYVIQTRHNQGNNFQPQDVQNGVNDSISCLNTSPEYDQDSLGVEIEKNASYYITPDELAGENVRESQEYSNHDNISKDFKF